jgi:hypothetical protein
VGSRKITPQELPGSPQYFSSIQLPFSPFGQVMMSDFMRMAK